MVDLKNCLTSAAAFQALLRISTKKMSKPTLTLSTLKAEMKVVKKKMRMNNCAAALASLPHSLGTSPPGDSQTARQQQLTSDEPQTFFKIFESTYVTPTFASLALKSE